MTHNLVTIATYSFPHEAYLAKARLDAEEIPAFVADEHIVNILWFYSNAVGGVKLQVFEKDRDKAKMVLDEDISVESTEMADMTETKISQNSGSKTIRSYTRRKQAAFFLFFLLSIPFLLYLHRATC